ncbi:MAG: hypothetical protein ACI9MR_003414 [Myxococcota bacterium]|jgi:hypothetical protein
MIRMTLACLATLTFLSVGAAGCASSNSDIVSKTEPSADEKAHYSAEAKSAINPSNAETALDDLATEIDGDDER